MLSLLPQKQQAQGLSLKAVYRDTVVGIRYLHLRDITAPVHRRFQITFLSSSAALEFIDAIRTICPCKANPLPGNVPLPAPVRNTPMAVKAFKVPLDTRSMPSTVEQIRNQGNPPSGLPSSLGPGFPVRNTQEPTHGLRIPFSSPQAFALTTSDPSMYQSSPLRGLASCVPNSSSGYIIYAANNSASAHLLSSNPTRSFTTYRNKCHYLVPRLLPLPRELASIPRIAMQWLTQITVLS